MRLFVTGGTGFVGSHFLKTALLAGHDVVALRRTHQSQPKIELPTQPKWIVGSLTSPSDTEIASSDCLVHLAASGVSETLPWEDLFQANVQDSLHLWLRAIELGVKHLVLCGSCFEYGLSGERYEFIPEDAPLEPITPYAASKAAATMAAISIAHERNISVSILRPFQVFGEGEADLRLWPSLKRAALAGEDYHMTAGQQVRDFVPVELVAEQLLNACVLNKPERGTTRIKNIGTGQPTSVESFCRTWWNHWGAKGKLLLGKIPYRTNEVMRYVPRIDVAYEIRHA